MKLLAFSNDLDVKQAFMQQEPLKVALNGILTATSAYC